MDSCHNFAYACFCTVRQLYTYDNLYQFIKVDGNTTYNPYQSGVPEFVSNYSQVFIFDTDGLGNMTSKVSTESVTPHKSIGDNLNYSFNYVYDENFAHRLINAGDRYYKYDSNGNIICEQDGSFESNGEDVSYHKITKETEDVYSTDYGWGLFKEENGSGGGVKGSRYCRTYSWNEKNQLVSSVDSSYNTAYVYGQDGQRSNKYTQSSETLYFNKMWTHHTDSGNNVYGGQSAKNIYLGETRIVTKLNSGENPTYQEEYYKQYYYHSDHLGSASLISDYKGDEYQRIEYTPYGETWVEKTSNTGMEYLPYKFTAKELDEETGLYYYGVRYLDPKYSMWISTDPALGEYIPKTPIDEETKKYNQNLPGMGGVFNTVNFNLYHYAGNNPVKYVDPDGRTEEIPDWNVVAKWEGTKAHAKIEGYLMSRYGGIAEVPVPGGGKEENTDGRADYVNGNEFYEIKPITQRLLPDGKNQLQKYVDNTDVAGAKKGTSLLGVLNGKEVGSITYTVPGVCTYTKSYRLVTFKDDPSQAGMIYYAQKGKVDYEPLKETAVQASKALKTTAEYALAGVALFFLSLVYN